MKKYIFENDFPAYDKLKYLSPYAQPHYYYILNNLHKDVKKVIAFGSSTTRAFTVLSDIDVILIVDSKVNVKEMSKIIYKLQVDVDLLIYTEEEFKNMLANSPNFKYSLDTKGVVLYERWKSY